MMEGEGCEKDLDIAQWNSNIVKDSLIKIRLVPNTEKSSNFSYMIDYLAQICVWKYRTIDRSFLPSVLMNLIPNGIQKLIV